VASVYIFRLSRINQTPSNGFASQNKMSRITKSASGTMSSSSSSSSPRVPPIHATGPCDRRLSRAARQILQEQLVPLLEQWLMEGQAAAELPVPPKEEKISKYFPTSLAPTYLWDIMERTSDNNCPLHPSNDVHYELESQSLVSVPRAPKLAPRKTYPHWYHCGICGKVFGTRYYLDIHQHAEHNDSLSDSNEQKSCLANTVCNALGGCDRMATVDLEPHYGRGSGEGGDQARSLQRAWATSHMEPCQDEVVQSQMKPACVQLVQDCFGNSDTEDTTSSLQKQLQEALCEPLSCHTLLHRQEWMHRHLAKSLWRNQLVELQHMHRSTAVIVVLVFLLLYYLIVVVGCSERGSHGGGSGSRTLAASNKKKGTRSFWSTLFCRKVKKKSL
jgi:hypothetical protein